jgi:putative ABC transport system permease protein
MLISYLKITWRNLWKNKALSAINIGGLAIGIASSLLLLGYVSFQLSFDNFHKNRQSIYRVDLDYYKDKQLVLHTAENYAALGPGLKADFPEVTAQARLYNMGYKNNCVFSYQQVFLKETKFLYADASFLTMFSFPFLQGDPQSALAQPFTAVISESMARKLFGPQGPQTALGKAMLMTDDDRNRELCKITGVYKDIPTNSHIRFNVLISYSTLYARRLDRFEHNWDQKDFYTYVQLQPGADPKALIAKLPAFVQRHDPGQSAKGEESRLSLQPLQNIHLTTGMLDEPEPTVKGKAIHFLMIIAFFIVAIAWINYINLATADSVNRAREIGVRKVLGSQRSQLIRQFLTESFFLNLIGCGLALILLYAAHPLLKLLFAIDFPLATLFNTSNGLLFLGFLAGGSFCSGLYPALVLSSFKPIAVLKRRLPATGGNKFRKTLVVFQFSLSILLIIGTIIVYQQVHYMLNRDLGIKVDQVVAIDRPGRWDTARATHNRLVEHFKEALMTDPAVAGIGMSDELPGKEIRFPSTFAPAATPGAHAVPINTTSIDEGFIPMLGITVLSGRNFSLAYKTDNKGVILTESAAKLLGYHTPEAAVGQLLHSDDGDYTVLGVVNDFHQMGLQRESGPSAFEFGGRDLREFEYYLVKVKAEQVPQALDRIKAAWDGSFPDNPFTFSFLDTHYREQYQADIQFGLLFGGFSILAIILACTGLFALLSLIIRQRTREIGVRKVLGAALHDLIFLLVKDFVRLLLLANLIAWPLGWWLMNSWLKDFAYHISIHWLVFLLAGSLTMLIALLTVGFQSLKAATANPVKSLRTE